MTPIIITLTITAIAAIAAMAIIAVGHQTEERPGTIDLTGIPLDGSPTWELREAMAFRRRLASRVRAEAAGLDPVALAATEMAERSALAQIPVVVDARMPRDVAAMVGDGVVDVFRVSDGAHVARTTLGELAGQPRGDEAA